MQENTETYHALLILMSALIILTNSYAIGLFMRNKSLFSKTNYLLFSLAMSEFMTGAVNLPTIVHGERYTASHGTETMTIMITADMTTVLCAAITMMTLCSIIVDRYLIICYPMHYVSIVTERKIVLVIIACWLLPVFFNFLRLAWLAPLLNVPHNELINITLHTDIRNNALAGDKYYFITGSSLYFLIVLTLAVLFVLMFRAIRRLGRDEREFTTENRDNETIKREHKAVILFGIMFIVFILCWTPLVVLRLITFAFPTQYDKIPPKVVHGLIITKYLTSVLNPLLYILYKFEFNQLLKKDWQRAKKLICCSVKKKRRNKKDVTEVSFLGHSSINGHSSTNGHQNTYWAHGNGYMRKEEPVNV